MSATIIPTAAFLAPSSLLLCFLLARPLLRRAR
jgi:hypothetical protein